MSLGITLLERFLRGLGLHKDLLTQFHITTRLGESDGAAFSKELLLLSAPVVVRGLLNFATLQMNGDWEYPYWVHRQLDPESDAFIPRAQNPLLVNVTHRSWTMVGTVRGRHEAVVDPRGLITPLPREWSVDVWLVNGHGAHFPARQSGVRQTVTTDYPSIVTTYQSSGMEVRTETIAATARSGRDVLFARAAVCNISEKEQQGALVITIRPFNPEGVAPITSVSLSSPRIIAVNGVPGVHFASAPDWVGFGTKQSGDLARAFDTRGMSTFDDVHAPAAACEFGLAHAAAAFRFALDPGARHTVDFSIALDDEESVRARPPSPGSRVRFEHRRAREQARWRAEIETGARFHFADTHLQQVMDAGRLTLLQLCDGDTITPGPWLYHRFWYRDAGPMLRALDQLGFDRSVRTVLDGFPRGQRRDGYFQGPDGEWDSNGTVLVAIRDHYLLTRSNTWLRRWYPQLEDAVDWIESVCRTSTNGLPPPGLSAEHFGTADQYYWDAFWSLAGMRAFSDIARILDKAPAAERADTRAARLQRALRASIDSRVDGLIPAAPGRAFDQSAIGSVCTVYPLALHTAEWGAPAHTVRRLARAFVGDRGFYHPVIHSGHNPYLTLQLAHAQLVLGDRDEAWQTARSILDRIVAPYSLPEALHPWTGGGAMGDGHHGWAAAETVLFLRDCYLREVSDRLLLLSGATREMLSRFDGWLFEKAPSAFGFVSMHVRHSGRRIEVELRREARSGTRPESVEIFFPWQLRRATAIPDGPAEVSHHEGGSRVRCSGDVHVLLCEY